MCGGKGKKSLAVCLILLLLLIGQNSGAQAAEETESGAHSTTVLVYLCGSDLESRFGAATDDIREMAASRFDSRYTTVLIMAGGARSWKSGQDAGKPALIEIGQHGMRRVTGFDETTNMADGGALKAFLEYGCRQYPAERTALILWGHGGGPDEGLFADERHDGDTLTLEEIETALSEGLPAGKKLSWIGFDACLMATLETARDVEDHAEYLIASQARENNSGWNYSFLRGLERDADGGETGRRIVEAYFAGADADEEARTLSCIRLDRIAEVREEAERYFGALNPPATEDSLTVFQQARERACSFGRTDDGEQDFIDLVSLSEVWEPAAGSGEALRAAVREAVVCSKANREGAHGLSAACPAL